MMVHKLKFAAVAAISLFGLSIDGTTATAGGCYDGCGIPVIVQPMPVYSSCSCCCGAASFGPGYYGGYRGGLYRQAAYQGFRGGLYSGAAYRGYRGGVYRRGYR